MTCNILEHIRAQKTQAFVRSEFAEFYRLLADEDKHIAKCFSCAAHVKPLYLQLWSNAIVGENTNATIKTHANDHHHS